MVKEARRITAASIFGGLLVVIGCIENTAYVTQERSDKVEKFLLKKEPKPEVALNAKFEDKATLLGYDLKADDPKLGDVVEVTWYWKVHKEIGAGWRLFTHGIGEDGEASLNADMHGEVRKHFQPEHWRAGMIVEDKQRIRVPKNWADERIELRTGIWKGSERLKGKGPKFDSGNRVIGPRIKIHGKGRPPATIPFVDKAPVIDGRFRDEAVWQRAVKLDPFVNPMNGNAVDFKTEVYLLWDAEHLYVAAFCEDDHLKSRYTNHDDELWKEDAFEIFLDPKGDKKDYYELQVNPKGVVFDSHLPRYRKNQNGWSSNMETAVQLEGTLNDASDDDKSWTVELKIPFASMTEGGGVPPRPGDKWRANFFRVDAGKAKKRYSAWSPPMRGDFHTLARFGTIVFEGGQDKPASTSAPAAKQQPDTKAPAAVGEEDRAPRSPAKRPKRPEGTPEPKGDPR